MVIALCLHLPYFLYQIICLEPTNLASLWGMSSGVRAAWSGLTREGHDLHLKWERRTWVCNQSQSGALSGFYYSWIRRQADVKNWPYTGWLGVLDLAGQWYKGPKSTLHSPAFPSPISLGCLAGWTEISGVTRRCLFPRRNAWWGTS